MRARNVSHPALTEFATIATAFCETVENVASCTPEMLLDQIHQLLPRAYSAALQLPETSVPFNDGADPVNASLSQTRRRRSMQLQRV